MADINEKAVPIDSVLSVKATGALREEIKEELEIETPDEQHAIASLEEDDE